MNGSLPSEVTGMSMAGSVVCRDQPPSEERSLNA